MMHVVTGAPAVTGRLKIMLVSQMQIPLLVLLRCGFNFGNTSDDKWHNVNSKNLLSMTQNTLEDTVLNIN